MNKADIIKELENIISDLSELRNDADAASKAVNKEGKPYSGSEYFRGKATAYAGAVAVITRRIDRLKTKLEKPYI